MVAGAIIGALGGAGLARGVNVVRGRSESSLRWDDAFLDGLVTSALLRYLAVAHYGRGRGAWREGEYPSFWRPMVVDAVVVEHERLAGVWDAARRGGGGDSGGAGAAGDDGAEAGVRRELEEVLGDLALGLLEQLYPGTLDIPSAGG
jgi:hypothetical protein